MGAKAKKNPAKSNWLAKYKYMLVFAFAFLIYANAIPNYYCMDDELVTTTQNASPHRLTSKGIAAISQIFTEPYYKDEQGYAYDYRPIVLVTFAIEHSLFGDNPHISHFINVILYAILCAVLLLTLSEVFKKYNLWLPLISTLIFAALPIHTEAVDSIKNRDEILALLFGLLAIFFLIKSVQHKKAGWVIGSVFFCALSLLSKATSVSFIVLTPFILILFYRGYFVPIVVYVLAGISFFILVSPTADFYLLFKTAIAINFFLLLIYAVTNLNLLTEKLKTQLNYINASVAARRFPSNPVTSNEETTDLPVSFTNKDLTLAGIILLATSVLLYYLSTRFYLLPLAFIALFPFIYKGSNKWLVPLLHLLAAVVILKDTENDVLSVAFALQLMYLYFYRRKNEYLFTLVAYTAFCPLVNNSWIQHTALFVTLYGAYRTKRFTALRYVPAIILPAVYIFKLASRPKFFFTNNILSFDIVNGFVILTLAVLPPLRKYLPLILSIQITTATIINNTYPNTNAHQLEIGKLTLMVDSFMVAATVPSVIDKQTIDRPVSPIESITNRQSSWEYRLGTTAQVFRKYLRLLFAPYPMSFYYGYKVIEKESVFDPINLFTCLVYMIIGIVGLIAIRKEKILAAGIFIYLISISIYSNLFFPVPGMMADRFLFVPSVGFCILLAYGILKVFKINVNDIKGQLAISEIPKTLKYTILSLLLVYSGITIARNTQWKDSLTLFKSDIDHLQESAQANNLYALQLMKYSYKETNKDKERQMRENAEKYFKQTLNIYPDFFNARYDLARTQSVLMKDDEAEKNFVTAAKMDPEFPTAWLSAAEVAMRNKRYANAIQYFASIPEKYLKQDPAIYSNWSYAYYLTQNYDSANYINKLGWQQFPKIPNFLLAIGQTFATINKLDSTLYYYEKALQLDPNNSQLQEQIRQLKINRK